MTHVKRNDNSRLLGYPPVSTKMRMGNPLFLHDWTEKTTTFAGGVILRIARVGKCPMTWVYWTSPKIVAIIDHIPNGWVMFNGDI